MIQAIPTRYKGYHFRSRLEARWAVFFDALGIDWQYEPEGYNLPSGSYLPDFFLRFEPIYRSANGFPNPGYLVEIKPFAPNIEEMQKLREASLFTRHHSRFCVGMPGEQNNVWSDYGESYKPESSDLMGAHVFQQCAAMYSRDHFRRAIEAARGARFEHGQSGASAPKQNKPVKFDPVKWNKENPGWLDDLANHI